LLEFIRIIESPCLFDDEATSIEAVIDALNDLKKNDKILTLSVSNWLARQIMESIGVKKAKGTIIGKQN